MALVSLGLVCGFFLAISVLYCLYFNFLTDSTARFANTVLAKIVVYIPYALVLNVGANSLGWSPGGHQTGNGTVW